jgi:dipeptidyl aminopeptidase/acylaminoacyl peptidase
MHLGRRCRNQAWKQRFRAPQVLTSAIASASPSRGIAATNRSGTYQLYRWDVPSGRLTQLTHRPAGIMQGVIAPDGRFVYYFADQQGQEIGHFVRVPYDAPYDAQPTRATTRAVRSTSRKRPDRNGDEAVQDILQDSIQDITPDLPHYALPSSPTPLAISRTGNRLALVAADGAGFHLYAVDVEADGSLRSPRPLWHSARDALGPALSADGEIGVVASDERTGTGRFSLRAFDMTNGQQIAELWDGPESSLEALAFSPVAGDACLLALTNRTGVETVLIWDPISAERTDLVWPELAGATRAFDWSPDGGRIVLRTLAQATQQFYVVSVAAGKLTRLAHPSGTYRNAYFASKDEILVHYSDSVHPTRLVALDAATGELRQTVLAAGKVPAGRPWRSITFPSTDGQQIQGWLGLPGGQAPFPAIIEAHGGPFNVQTDAFSPSSQAWLDHGYAYLTINYRGSTTFGRAFQEQIAGHPGDWEVEDLAAARDWLVRQGVAQPGRILLTGWSYGGYLTLQALGRKPDLWAGGMAGSPITDWRLTYAEASPAMRIGVASFLGGTPDEKPEQYAASSPMTSLARVAAPILILQGRGDSRTPPRPVEEYVARARAAGKQVELHWYDTGHLGPLLQTEESIHHHELMLAFTRRVLRRPLRS